MSAYTDAAPNVSALKSLTQFKIDFPEPSPPSPGPPQPNAAKKRALYDAYLAEYQANGGAVALSRLARTMNVPRNWCLILDREVRAAMAVVYADPE